MSQPTPDRPLIIERPDLQTAGQRFGYLSLTFICWVLWLYLFVPLLSLFAWFLGARTVYEAMIQNLSVSNLLQILKLYGSGIAVLTLAYLLWAVTSYLRFRSVDRREPQQPVSATQLAASHRLSLETVKSMQRSRRMVISEELLVRMFGFPKSGPANNGTEEAETEKDQAA